LLLPWPGALGIVDYRANLKFPGSPEVITGLIGIEGTVFPFPRFPHAVRDYEGLIRVNDRDLTITNFRGKLGGGDLVGSGRIHLGPKDVDEIDIRAEGRNLQLSLLERTMTQAQGTMRLLKDPDKFVLSGDFNIQRLLWRREIDEKFVFSSNPYYLMRREPGFFDDLTLDIRLRAEEDAWMENTLGRFRGRFDLTVGGNINSPILLGDLEAVEGDVYFQDRQFRIIRGRVSFFNPLLIEPYLSFQGETYIKDYRVTFALDGLWPNIVPELNSSPPLPPEDVLALLTLGESFRRTYHYDRSASQGTASLLSFQLSEEAKKRAESLFNIDRFRIDPFVMGSSAEMTARLTVGKKLSRNFFILYSTNLATQREEITRIEWELTRDLSIVATRDEEGRVSLDVKIHKRF
ncbi:translocation/assembly module TamB domain-containing protein, partial [Acidobacteriota bacterium]